LYRQVLAARQRVQGPNHPDTLTSLGELADFLAEQNRSEEAEQLCRQLLHLQRPLLPADHPDLAFPLTSLGDLLSVTGRAKEAEPLLQEALALREKKLPASNWRTAHSRSILGHCLAQQRRFAEAEPLLLSGYEGLARATEAPAKWLAQSLDRVIELYERWKRPEQAEQWRKKRPAAEK
jgi:tetratricopeptide (TPR) repeat protein